MHICFINPHEEYYSPVCGGAISTIIMEVARQLIARGHRVSIVTMLNGAETYRTGEIVPITVPGRKDLTVFQRGMASLRRRLHHWDWPRYAFYRDAVSAAVRRLQPSAIVLFNDLVSPRYLRGILPDVRIAVWLQNEWRTHKKNLRPMLASTDCMLTCSEYIRYWTASTHDIAHSRFTVAPSGVDLEAFHPRTSWLEPASPLRVLFIGRIDPNKGPDLAADAVAKLRRRGIAIELTVAGGLWWYGHGRERENPYFRQLEARMQAAQANYLGHVPRDCVPELLREHDVVCVLSRSSEPFALVVLEAMASGCAVVSSGRGGLLQSCGGAALIADPDDRDAIVRCLHTLATNPELLQQQKRRALERARHAPWSACAETVESALCHAK